MTAEIENIKTDNQVKSKKRVTDHGEVFTSEREVNAMLDMVKQETERIDSRFLEPACGTGNFLVEVLRRKLTIVENRYKKSQLEFERYAVIAISSIYGVDILEDNVMECRNRLFEIFDKKYTTFYKTKCKEECRTSIKYILERNILRGDALTLKTVGNDEQPIVFSEWSAVNGSMIKRRDFTMDNLLKVEASKVPDSLFSDFYETDPAFLPKPVKEFPLTHFLKLANHA
jgi:SAM-dependent methyltransferase